MGGIMGQIYMLKNKINSKVYIGQTIRTLDYRYGSNGIRSVLVSSHNEHLRKSIAKYGIDNFEIIILHDSINEKQKLNELEQYYIKEYDSTNPHKGYNKILSHESMGDLTRKRIICLNDGCIYDSLTDAADFYGVNISKVSAVCNGKRNHTKKLQFAFYEDGMDYTLENSSSVALNKNGKPVICINEQRVFNSIAEAARYYNLNTDSISKCCNGRNISTKDGLQFAFYEEGKTYNVHNQYTPPTKKVICVDTGEIFNSAEEACERFNVSISNLRSVLQGRSKTAKKLRFQYLSEVNDINIETMKSIEGYTGNHKKKVICLNTGVIYDSILQASKTLGIDKKSITDCCNGKSIQSKGLYFEFYNDSFDYSQKMSDLKIKLEQDKEIKVVSRNSRSVICIDTGKVYNSMAEAGYEMGAKSGGSIQSCCEGITKTAHGYQWAYYEEGKEYQLNPCTKYYGKPVICIDTQLTYVSAKHAADELDLNEDSIRSCCNGKYKSSGGYQWAYYEEGKLYELIAFEKQNGKAVICIDTGIIYNSVVHAAKELNINKSTLYNCCAGRISTAGGYQWAYYEEGKIYSLKENKCKRKSKKVICINSQEVFDSIEEASIKCHVSVDGIRRCCSGKLYATEGLQFSYYEEGKTYTLKELNNTVGCNKKVICIDTLEIFNSAKEASIKYNIHKSSISSCCTGKNLTAGGYQWSFYVPGKEYKLQPIPDKLENIKRKVICVNTGEIFESIIAASRFYNITESKIRKACYGDQLTAGGYQWKYYQEGETYELLPLPIKGEKSKKKVLCVETNTIYNSQKEARQVTGITTIGDCLRGRIKKAGGYTWVFYTEKNTD